MTHFILLLLVAASVSTEAMTSTDPGSEVTTVSETADTNNTQVSTETMNSTDPVSEVTTVSETAETSTKQDNNEPFSKILTVGILLTVMVVCFLLVFSCEICPRTKQDPYSPRVKKPRASTSEF